MIAKLTEINASIWGSRRASDYKATVFSISTMEDAMLTLPSCAYWSDAADALRAQLSSVTVVFDEARFVEYINDQKAVLSFIDERLVEQAMEVEGDADAWYNQRLADARAWLECGQWRGLPGRLNAAAYVAQRFFDGVVSPFAIEEQKEAKEAEEKALCERRKAVLQQRLNALYKENRDDQGGESRPGMAVFVEVSQAIKFDPWPDCPTVLRGLIVKAEDKAESLLRTEVRYLDLESSKSEWRVGDCERLRNELLTEWATKKGHGYSGGSSTSRDGMRSSGGEYSSWGGHCFIPEEIHSDFHACVAWCRTYLSEKKAALETLLAAVEAVV